MIRKRCKRPIYGTFSSIFMSSRDSLGIYVGVWEIEDFTAACAVHSRKQAVCRTNIPAVLHHSHLAFNYAEDVANIKGRRYRKRNTTCWNVCLLHAVSASTRASLTTAIKPHKLIVVMYIVLSRFPDDSATFFGAKNPHRLRWVDFQQVILLFQVQKAFKALFVLGNSECITGTKKIK